MKRALSFLVWIRRALEVALILGVVMVIWHSQKPVVSTARATLLDEGLSLPKMLTGPNAFEISNIGSQSYPDDQDVTTLHCVERRRMEFLRTTGGHLRVALFALHSANG